MVPRSTKPVSPGRLKGHGSRCGGRVGRPRHGCRPSQPGTAWRGLPDFSKDEDGHKETARDHVISGRGYIRLHVIDTALSTSERPRSLLAVTVSPSATPSIPASRHSSHFTTHCCASYVLLIKQCVHDDTSMPDIKPTSALHVYHALFTETNVI